jgi:hypothetical protein
MGRQCNSAESTNLLPLDILLDSWRPPYLDLFIIDGELLFAGRS